jgi:hypothetical protein
MADALLTEEEMQALSDDFAFARPQRCTILRPVTSKDLGGAVTRTFQATEQSPVPCRIDTQNKVIQEGVIGPSIQPVVSYTVSLPRHTEIGPSYRIKVDGITLEVGGVPGLASYYAEIEIPAVQVADTVFR